MAVPERKPLPPNPPLLKSAAVAPFIYFDGAPAYGCANGIVEIELAARVLMPKNDGTAATDLVCVSHLRCSAAAASNLREALDKAIEMLTQQGQPKH
jgi:hypothetical protein